MSNVLSYSWALPFISIIAATTFVTVHVSSGKWKEPPILSNGGEYGTGVGTGKEVAGGGMMNDEGVRPFTYVPTATPNEIDGLVPVPTTIVIGHNIPPGDAAGGDGSDLTWNIPFGEPTPDPALLYDPATPPAFINKGDGGGGQWGYPPGNPTPDPAQLNGGSGGNSGSSMTLKWNIPLVRAFVACTALRNQQWIDNFALGPTNPRSGNASQPSDTSVYERRWQPDQAIVGDSIGRANS